MNPPVLGTGVLREFESHHLDLSNILILTKSDFYDNWLYLLIKDFMEKYNKLEFIDIVSNSKSRSEVCKKIGFHNNGRNMRVINDLILELNIDITHFERIDKYPTINKICPICSNNFETKNGHKKEKITCSNSCSNTYFRSNVDHPNWKPFSDYSGGELRSSNFSKKYRKLCFKYHKHECVVCGENKILDVHHYDEDRTNNKIENLIPICPTHHGYYHSKYKEEVKNKIDNYYNLFLKNNKQFGISSN